MKDIKKYSGTTFDFKMTFLKPFIASVLMGAAAFAAFKLIFLVTSSNDISTLLSIIVGVVVYGALVLSLKVITEDEIRRLPKGDKLVKVLDKFIK